MLEVEGKLLAWLYCQMARKGLQNGWMMAFLVAAVITDPATFWWRVPVLYAIFVALATIVVRIAPESVSEGDLDWSEAINARKQLIENRIEEYKNRTRSGDIVEKT